MRSDEVIARESARRADLPREREPLRTSYASGNEIYAGDEIIDLGDGRWVLNELDDLHDLLKQTFSAFEIRIAAARTPEDDL